MEYYCPVCSVKFLTLAPIRGVRLFHCGRCGSSSEGQKFPYQQLATKQDRVIAALWDKLDSMEKRLNIRLNRSW